MRVFIILSALVAVLALAHGFSKHHDGTQSDHQRAAVRVGYHLWFLPDPQTDHEEALQNVQIEDKSSFYQVMVAAANSGDSSEMKYKFSALNTTFGHYVTAIGGYAEDQPRNIYWMLYKFPAGQTPNPQAPPPDSYQSELGVDAVQVSDGDVYLFWRKVVVW